MDGFTGMPAYRDRHAHCQSTNRLPSLALFLSKDSVVCGYVVVGNSMFVPYLAWKFEFSCVDLGSQCRVVCWRAVHLQVKSADWLLSNSCACCAQFLFCCPPPMLVCFPLCHVVLAGQCEAHRLVRVRVVAGVILRVGNTHPAYLMWPRSLGSVFLNFDLGVLESTLLVLVVHVCCSVMV